MTVSKSERLPYRLRYLCLAILFPALLLVAVACGGDGGSSDNPGITPAASNGTQSPGENPPDPEISDKLAGLSAEWTKATGKVTYTVDHKEFGQSDSPRTVLVLYFAPPKFRADASEGVGVASSSSTVIYTPEVTFACSPEQGCATSNGDNAKRLMDTFDPAVLDTMISKLTGEVTVESSQEQFAGKDATCVTAKGDLPGEEGYADVSLIDKRCFASNGLLLFQSYSDDLGTATIQATDVDEVKESDFTPPYPVTTSTPAAPAPTPGG